MLKVIVLLSLVAVGCAVLFEAFEIVDPNDEEVVEAANHVTKVLSKQFAGKYHHKLAKVLSAKKQVVSGTNFQMDIIVGQTECLKDEVEFENLDDCDFRTGLSVFKKCITSVFRDLNGQHKVGMKGCILATKKEIEGI